MLLIPMDRLVWLLRPGRWHVAQGPKGKHWDSPSATTQEEQSPDLVAGGRASVAIISPGDLIIRILGFDLLS